MGKILPLFSEETDIEDGCHVRHVIHCLEACTVKPYNIFNILNILNKTIFILKPMTDINSTAKLFKALMHPARLSILEALRNGEECVCHLEAVLSCRQAYISQHLMVLREAGLVVDRREGARIFYRVIKPEVFDLVDAANRMGGVKVQHFHTMKKKDCPCPKCNPVQAGNTLYKCEH